MINVLQFAVKYSDANEFSQTTILLPRRVANKQHAHNKIILWCQMYGWTCNK